MSAREEIEQLIKSIEEHRAVSYPEGWTFDYLYQVVVRLKMILDKIE